MMRKNWITEYRELVKEVKRDGQTIWLARDVPPDPVNQDARGFQFVPVGTSVLVIDARGTTVKGMPTKNKKAINELLATALKGIKHGDAAVSTAEISAHVTLK